MQSIHKQRLNTVILLHIPNESYSDRRNLTANENLKPHEHDIVGGSAGMMTRRILCVPGVRNQDKSDVTDKTCSFWCGLRRHRRRFKESKYKLVLNQDR